MRNPPSWYNIEVGRLRFANPPRGVSRQKVRMTNITDYVFFGLAGFFYVIGEYKLAFWISTFGIVNHAGAAVRAVVNPDWYFRKRMEAKLPVDLFNSGIRQLLVIKAIMIGVLVWAAWRAGIRAGYF